MLKTFVKYYLPTIVWAGLIFYFSSIPGLRYFDEVDREIFFRKGAHLFEYAGLTFLVWRVFYIHLKISNKKSFGLSFLVASLYAVSDEFHQVFVSNRSGEVVDGIFDFLSIFLALEIIYIFIIKKRKYLIWWMLFLTIFSLFFLEYKMAKTSEITVSTVEDKTQKEDTPDLLFREEEANITENEKEAQVEESFKVPSKILIKVPFTSQAPFRIWDEKHEEACEEASLIMLKYFLNGKSLSAETAEQEIQNLIDFQIKNYGGYKDTAVAETIKLAEDFYGIKNLKVIYDFSKDDLKKYLSQGNPIIVPAAGRLLGNPYFTPPGPLYHNLVLIGYNKDIIITNDPGTKRGKGYTYNVDTLYEAIHDFPGNKDQINNGRKAMIVVK